MTLLDRLKQAEAAATPEKLALVLSQGTHNNAADAIMVGEEGGAFCVPVGLRELSVLLVLLRNHAAALIRLVEAAKEMDYHTPAKPWLRWERDLNEALAPFLEESDG